MDIHEDANRGGPDFDVDAPKKRSDLRYSKEWCLEMADLEGDGEVGVGSTPEFITGPDSPHNTELSGGRRPSVGVPGYAGDNLEK